MNKKIIALIGAIIVILCVVMLFVLGKNGKYEVKFNTNGGTIIEVQSIKKGETASKPADPTKDGYVFDNWYLNDEVYDFSKEVTEDITLEARWTEVDIDKEEYTVTFNTDGGSKISSVKVTEGNKVTKPTNPTKDGYKFAGWLLNGKSYDFTKEVTGNITLVASWEKTDTVKVTGVSVSKTALSLKVGDTSTLTVTIKPTDATNKTATWKTSNAKIATVSNGKVTAVGAGTATITVTVDGKSATSKVTVAKAETNTTEVKVTGVTLDKSTVSLTVGGSADLKATINPDNATNKTATWTSSNENVATVANGKVTAKAAGEATITVTVDGKTATAKVTVTKAEVKVTSVTLNKSTLDLKVGATENLTATIKPTDATNKTATWSSSNTKVATVANGKVTAVGAGEATITVTVDGKSATAKVTVAKEVTYSVEMVDVGDAGQVILYIKDSEGNRVSGKIKIVTTGNDEGTVNTGDILFKKNIKSATVQSID